MRNVWLRNQICHFCATSLEINFPIYLTNIWLECLLANQLLIRILFLNQVWQNWEVSLWLYWHVLIKYFTCYINFSILGQSYRHVPGLPSHMKVNVYLLPKRLSCRFLKCLKPVISTLLISAIFSFGQKLGLWFKLFFFLLLFLLCSLRVIFRG